MPKYRVRVSADVTVYCLVDIEADDPEAASEAAIAKSLELDVDWKREDAEMHLYVMDDEITQISNGAHSS